MDGLQDFIIISLHQSFRFLFYILLYILYGEKEASINHLWLFNRMLIRPIIHREYDNIQQFNDSHRFNYLFLST